MDIYTGLKTYFVQQESAYLLPAAQKYAKIIAVAIIIFSSMAAAYYIFRNKFPPAPTHHIKFPDEIFETIISHLDEKRDIVRISAVSKKWTELCDRKIIHWVNLNPTKPLKMGLYFERFINSLKKYGNELTSLRLDKIGDHDLKQLITHSPKIQKLFIQNSELSDYCLTDLSELKDLRELEWSNCTITKALSYVIPTHSRAVNNCQIIQDDGRLWHCYLAHDTFKRDF